MTATSAFSVTNCHSFAVNCEFTSSIARRAISGLASLGCLIHINVLYLAKSACLSKSVVTFCADATVAVSATNRSWAGDTMATTQVEHYTVGTLVIDLFDAKTKQAIFRGVATDPLSDKPENNEDKLNKSVERMFNKFPPQSAS